MTFDAITYAVARESKPPAGCVLPSFAVDPAILQQGWSHLDGSLISRAQHPDAISIIGDARFFDSTPTVTETVLTMPAGVTSMFDGKQVAVGDTFVFMPSQKGTSSIFGLRLWRSTDAGANWAPYDLGAMPYRSTNFTVEHLEWFGGNRLLLVIRGNESGGTNYSVVFSNDLGQTWSTPKLLVNVTAGGLSLLSVSADAEMSSSGAGYYYFSFYFGETVPSSSYIVAFNTATNMAYSFTVNSDGTSDSNCRLLGGRVISAGNSELHFAAYAAGSWTMKKLNFNGTAFSGLITSEIPYSANYVGMSITSVSSGRQYLTSASGNYYLNRGGTTYKLPAGWSGTPQIVHVGLDNTGIRLLTNTLSNPVTGQRFDLTTGLKSSVGGMNAGSIKIGSFYGFANIALSEAIVVDRAPSGDRHFVCPSGGGALIVRTTRCADNFVGGLSNSSDVTRFLSYTAAHINWYNANTGSYKTVNFFPGTTNKLQVNSYVFANDYSNYLQLPYLPGLVCRLK
jgi:hypothetical protein